MARSPSVGSCPPAHVCPPPAYIAALGASQVASEPRRRPSDDERAADPAASAPPPPPPPPRAEVHFSPAALALVNAFLDQLLYAVLAHARSTTLTALRPAVVEVLKARLAADAIASAEAELAELLAGGEEEEDEMDQRQSCAERHRRWDTELVWKRTRLRVMVYIRLGEMEDDDEERHVRDDELFHPADRRFSHSAGLVSWAAAIFLTSVLEYVAERVLRAAGQAAASRARRQSRTLRAATRASGVATPVDGVTVEDCDMERVALNSTLGRLWRTWRRSLRIAHPVATDNGSPPTPTSNSSSCSRTLARDHHAHGAAMSQTRSSSGNVPVSPSALDDASRPASASVHGRDGPAQAAGEGLPDDAAGEGLPDEAAGEGLPDEAAGEGLPEAPHPEYLRAADTSPPIERGGQRELDEIEAGGLARDPDEAEGDGNHTAVERSNPGQQPSQDMDHPVDYASLPGTVAASLTTAAAGAASIEHVEAGATRYRGTAAGSAAAAAAAVSMVYGDRLRTELCEVAAGVSPDQATVEPVDSPVEKQQPDTAWADKKSMIDLIKSGQLEPPPHAESDDVDERDNQKQFVDKRRLSIPPGNKRGPCTAEQSPGDTFVAPVEHECGRDSPTLKAARSPKVSQDSFALDHGTEISRPMAQPRHLSRDFENEYASGPPADIGVARTSDTAVSSGEVPQEEFYPARDSFNPAPKRRSRVILTSPDVTPAPVTRDSTPSPLEPDTHTGAAAPARFLVKRSLTTKAVPSDKREAHTAASGEPSRSPVQRSGRGPPGLAVATSETPAPEKTPSPWRQSFSAAVKDGTSWTPHSRQSASVSGPASAVPVQEHPLVFKMGSNRRDSRGKEESEKNALTSASIKGPEDFETFVQGGDTVKYTLTPVSVRGDPSPKEANPRPKASSSRSTEKAPSSPNMPAPFPSPPAEEPRAGRSQEPKQVTAAADDRGRSSRRENRRSISRPPVRNTSVHRMSGLMAREPQVCTESTRDFADFIRSTGPTREPEIRPLVGHRSSVSLHLRAREPSIYTPRAHSPAPSVRSVSSVSRIVTAADAPPVPPILASAAANPNRNITMQPRNAQVSHADGTSELIDFIRTGPSGAAVTSAARSEQRQHRISRAVAPFRTTMDSDQLQEWGDRNAVHPDPPLNTHNPVGSMAPSVNSECSAKSSNRASANSRSALLQHTSAGTTDDSAHPAHAAGQRPRWTPPVPNTLPWAGGEPVPRRRVRNMDPCAVDLSDEDEPEPPKPFSKNRRQVESLIDFLRNSEPPLSNNPRSPRRAGSSQPHPAAGPGTFGADAVSMGRRGSPAGPRDAPPKLEPRRDGPSPSPPAAAAATSDLAHFLMSSGPPDRPLAQPSLASATPSTKRSLAGFFAAVFAPSKRKSPAPGYLDM